MDFFQDDDDEIGIDLTPLIDVVFMLLIFFVMTTTFNKPVLEILLPKAETAELSSEKGKEILLSVTKNGSLFYKNEPIDIPSLIELLQTETATLNIYIDREAPFEAFVKVVDIAKVEREGRFVISTEKQ